MPSLKLLFSLISAICTALPARSVKTFIELLLGAMFTNSGHITQTVLALNLSLTWTSYYKFLGNGKWVWKKVVLQYIFVITNFIYDEGDETLYISIDDTAVYRSSKKAPCVKFDYEHSNKQNRSKYVLAQTWVSAAITIFNKEGKPICIPAISDLAEVKGNATKIEKALDLLTDINCAVKKDFRKVLLVDAWFMKKSFILPAIDLGYQVIGQVRKDTILYLPLECKTKKGKGRPKKNGAIFTLDEALKMRFKIKELFIYGKMNKVKYISKLVHVKFLKGRLVRAVWCQIYDEKKNKWSKPSLIISTNHELEAETIITEYAYRWPIESFFNEIKNHWGMKEAWQQKKETLLRWFHINCMAYGLFSIFTNYAAIKNKNILDYLPWRNKYEITVGMLRTYCQIHFSNVSIRELWSDKDNKIIYTTNDKLPITTRKTG